MFLWDYAIELRAIIHNSFHLPLFQDRVKMPHECTFGHQSDISNICNFGSNEWAHCSDFGSFPENKEKPGRALGLRKNEGKYVSQSIVSSSGYVINRRTIMKR